VLTLALSDADPCFLGRRSLPGFGSRPLPGFGCHGRVGQAKFSLNRVLWLITRVNGDTKKGPRHENHAPALHLTSLHLPVHKINTWVKSPTLQNL